MVTMKVSKILGMQFLLRNNMHLNVAASFMQFCTPYGKVQAKLYYLYSNTIANANDRAVNTLPNDF